MQSLDTHIITADGDFCVDMIHLKYVDLDVHLQLLNAATEGCKNLAHCVISSECERKYARAGAPPARCCQKRRLARPREIAKHETFSNKAPSQNLRRTLLTTVNQYQVQYRPD